MATSKAPTSQFVCVECGYTAPKWLGKCPGCGNFNTMQEELIKPAESAKKSSRPALSDMGGGTRALPPLQSRLRKIQASLLGDRRI